MPLLSEQHRRTLQPVVPCLPAAQCSWPQDSGNLQTPGGNLILTSSSNDCSLHSNPCSCLQKVHGMSSASSPSGFFTRVLSAQGRVYWNASLRHSMDRITHHIHSFHPKKGDNLSGNTKWWMSAKWAVSTTPGTVPIFLSHWNSACFSACLQASFMLWLKPTMKLVWAPYSSLFLQEKGISLTRVAIWTTEPKEDTKSTSLPE